MQEGNEVTYPVPVAQSVFGPKLHAEDVPISPPVQHSTAIPCLLGQRRGEGQETVMFAPFFREFEQVFVDLFLLQMALALQSMYVCK